jgi:ABC-type multidrug transport system permease subunit
MNFFYFFAIVYVLAMAATAVAVLLGCSVGDPKMGQEFLPVLFVPQLLFAGFFVPTGFIPVWLRWVQYVCSLTYAVRIAVEAEFRDCASNENFIPNFCQNLLEASNVDQIPIYGYWLILIALFVFFRVAALLVLKQKAMTFF